MTDEFIRLSNSSETNLDVYLTALDRYLLERYNKIIKEQRFLEKIRNKIGTSWDFIQLYEKARDLSKKNKTHLVLEYIDLLDKTKNIGDDWITHEDIRKSVENIKNRMYEKSKSKFDEISQAILNLKTIFDKNLKILENGSDKLKGYEKQSLTQLKENITMASKALSKTNEQIPKLKN